MPKPFMYCLPVFSPAQLYNGQAVMGEGAPRDTRIGWPALYRSSPEKCRIT